VHTFQFVTGDLVEIRIISARKAERSEAQQYQEGMEQ